MTDFRSMCLNKEDAVVYFIMKNRNQADNDYYFFQENIASLLLWS